MSVIKKEFRITPVFQVDHIWLSERKNNTKEPLKEIQMSTWTFKTKEEAEKFISEMEAE